MRPLTSDELKLLLERGLEALPDRNATEVVEALALEVSERRVAEAAAASGPWRARFRGITGPSAAWTPYWPQDQPYTLVVRDCRLPHLAGCDEVVAIIPGDDAKEREAIAAKIIAANNSAAEAGIGEGQE